MELTKTKFKQTEIGLIPNDWELKKIDEIVKISTGSKNTQDKIEDGKYPFYVRSQTIERINSYSYDCEAVLTVGDGVGTGKVFHYVNQKFELHQRVYIMNEFVKGLNGYYFFLFFSNNFYDRVMQMTAKSSVDSVRREMIADMKMPLPPLPEQKAIAQVLSDTDNLIQALEKKLAKKRAIKQGAMQLLLTPKEDWEVRKLGELIHSFQNGYGFSASGYVENGTPIVTMAQIGLDGTFQFNENKVNYWQKKDFKSLSNYHLNNGDVIIAMTDVTPNKNLIGRMTIVKTSNTLLLNQRVGLLRIDKNKINSVFLKTYSNMKKWRDYCIGSASLGVQANIGTSDILNGLIQLPDIEEQTHIATILSDMDAEIEQLEQKLNKYKLLKQGSMQELLTGRIRLV